MGFACSESILLDCGINVMIDAVDILNQKIAQLRLENEQLKEELRKYEADAVHSCHDECTRPMCVLRRENERLRNTRSRY